MATWPIVGIPDQKRMKAILVLEDGAVWEGQAIGATGTSLGEAVFNTSMTGYQEMLTDPSYAGQILTLTYPLIGNYGVTDLDDESRAVQVSGFVVRELAEVPSNWRSAGTLQDYLVQTKVVGIQGVDTRALAKHLRTAGVMMGAVSTEFTADELLAQIKAAPNYGTFDFVKDRSVTVPTVWTGGIGDDPVRAKWLKREGRATHKVALLDLGVKNNIMRTLTDLGCEVIAWPCDSAAEAVLE